jgi:hypothetical protein
VDYLLTGQPLIPADAEALSQAVERNLPDRSGRNGLTREELAVLFAAVLTEA